MLIWKQDNIGWRWYLDKDTYSKGWKQIDGNWYYFYNSGYMAHDTLINDYYLNSKGAWSKNMPGPAIKDDFYSSYESPNAVYHYIKNQ